MATAAAQPRQLPIDGTAFGPWLRQFLHWEVAPYPGRTNTVVRMVVAATMAMLVVETFRVPRGVLAGFYTLLISRESLASTWRQGTAAVMGVCAGTIYMLVGMMLFHGYPVVHFYWVIGTLFLVFFVMRTVTNFGAALGFSLLIGATLAVWDQPLPSEVQVVSTLWEAGAIAIGVGVTLATEAVYHIFDHSDPVMISIDDLLLIAQSVAESVAGGTGIPEIVRNRVLQYEMTGTGRLRISLLRLGVDPTRRAHLSALISLAGRLLELMASLAFLRTAPSEEDAGRLRAVSQRLGDIRVDLKTSGIIAKSSGWLGGEPSATMSDLLEIERIVMLITEIFHRDEVINNPSPEQLPRPHLGLFLPDAFQNREYVRFAFAGCMATSLCYILYNALAWPGISTSIITCVVTALSTLGNSHQRQFFRLAGYVCGGLVIGIPLQILILPNIDTVFGFSLLFAAGSAVAAWLATSSPQLSYFGLQFVLPFYFITLQDFHVDTNLITARDNVIGVLLGIIAMGLLFDRRGAKSAADEMRRLFVQNVSLLARLGSYSIELDKSGALPAIQGVRSQINDNFNSLAAQMDAVSFEFGADRDQHLAERARMRRAQPALRSIYVSELALLEYRDRWATSSEFHQPQKDALNGFMTEFSNSLCEIAAGIKFEPGPTRIEESAQRVQEAFQERVDPYAPAVLDVCQQMSVALRSLNESFVDS